MEEQSRILTQDEYFKNHLPDTLWMSHYDLAKHFIHYTPEEWRQYLRDNERFITREIAAMTEAEARKALSRLSSPNQKLSAQDVQAIKQILDRSEQINKQTQDARTFVTTYMPNQKLVADYERRIKELQDLVDAHPEIKNKQYYAVNKQKVKEIYYPDSTEQEQQFYIRIRNGEIKQNEDGTISIPNPTTEQDYLYLGINTTTPVSPSSP